MSLPFPFSFSVNKQKKQIRAARSFEAPLSLVWEAWTNAEILDEWWAPLPWQAKTKTMDFREGGKWHYCMSGPAGERHWCLFEYDKIHQKKKFSGRDAFCNEAGVIDANKPRPHWENRFASDGNTTTVTVEVSLEKLSDLELMVESGFGKGLEMGLSNLDHYLSTHFRLRKENKTNHMSRVTTYLNFPGKTEEAFLFYKKVFKGAFTGAGLKRFGDIEMPAGVPSMSEADKKLIIHAELTILGGHVLMATDSPESMGFKLQVGNNMHINLEPDSREETERLFKELSAGGTVTMPLQDMFWGAYYGTFTDKYGINWMVNYQQG